VIELKAPLVEAGTAFLGVDTVAAEGPGGGARVIKVTPGAPAQRGGVKVDDVIHAFSGEKVQSVLDLARLIQAHATGDLVKLSVDREGKSLELAVRLGGRVEPAK
jgi:serine protease Do